jgi:hypothetical protein
MIEFLILGLLPQPRGAEGFLIEEAGAYGECGQRGYPGFPGFFRVWSARGGPPAFAKASPFACQIRRDRTARQEGGNRPLGLAWARLRPLRLAWRGGGVKSFREMCGGGSSRRDAENDPRDAGATPESSGGGGRPDLDRESDD